MANVTKTIPNSQGAFWKCSINGVTYEYKAGETVDVPDYVGALIDHELRQSPTYDDPTVRLTTEISEASTDKEVPSAKAVYDISPLICHATKNSSGDISVDMAPDDIVKIAESGRTLILTLNNSGLLYYLQEAAYVPVIGYSIYFSCARFNNTVKAVTFNQIKYGRNGPWEEKILTIYSADEPT